MKINKLIISGFTLIIFPVCSINIANASPQCVTETKEQFKRFVNPTKSGLRIDKCVQGDGWSLINPKRCDRKRQRTVANNYCRLVGYEKSNSYKVSTHIGNHSILSYRRGGRVSPQNWTQVAGTHAFTLISCSKKVSTTACEEKPRVKQTYRNPVIRGLAVDKCVQGAGWGLLDPKRCDHTRRKQVADGFCRNKRFEKSDKSGIKKHIGNHSIWTYARSRHSTTGVFTQVIGSDAFSSITCSKAAE